LGWHRERERDMLDKFMEKMIENATSACIPKVEEKANARKVELAEMKVKVRTNPEQVETWFDKEIDKSYRAST
jgi:hypothetical protein